MSDDYTDETCTYAEKLKDQETKPDQGRYEIAASLLFSSRAKAGEHITQHGLEGVKVVEAGLGKGLYLIKVK